MGCNVENSFFKIKYTIAVNIGYKPTNSCFVLFTLINILSKFSTKHSCFFNITKKKLWLAKRFLADIRCNILEKLNVLLCSRWIKAETRGETELG